MSRSIIFNAVLVLSALMSPAFAAPEAFDVELRDIQQQWSVANYQSPSQDARKQSLEVLSEKARQFSQRNPQRAEALIWEGIVLSTYAGAKGGLGALGIAKKSRGALEAALQIDPGALQGSAYTSLGVLYAKVPGFPLGFGDDDKARELLLKALSINPDGVDPNYFYAEFLCDHQHCEQALPYLEKAAQAAPRPGREVADQGRHGEVLELMTKAREGRQARG